MAALLFLAFRNEHEVPGTHFELGTLGVAAAEARKSNVMSLSIVVLTRNLAKRN